MSLEIKPLKCIVLPVKLRSDTGRVSFGVEYFKSLKGQENLLLKYLQLKTHVQNVFVGKYSIQSTNEMALKRTVTLRASF